MHRALQEFRIRGVKTNIGFLEKVITHPAFLAGKCDTSFLDAHPELFELPVKKDRANKTAQLHRPHHRSTAIPASSRRRR